MLTGDLSGQVWRHHIDGDGVETWRKADDEAAIGALHREQLAPGRLAAEAEVTIAEDAMGTPSLPNHGAHAAPNDLMLGRAENYAHAIAALRAAREAGETPETAATHIHALQAALLTLEAHVAAAGAQNVLTQLHGDGLQPARFALQLAQIEESLRHELGLIRSVADCAAAPVRLPAANRRSAGMSQHAFRRPVTTLKKPRCAWHSAVPPRRRSIA